MNLEEKKKKIAVLVGGSGYLVGGMSIALCWFEVNVSFDLELQMELGQS